MQYAQLEETVYFHFASNNTSGSGDDGAAPAADVRLAGGGAADAPILSPTPILLTHANYPPGTYEVAIPATAANGFVAFGIYAVFCTLLVDSQNPTGFVGSFKLGPILTGVSTGTPAVTATGGLSVAALTIITNAYHEIGRLNPDGSLSSEDAQFGFEKLNRLISVWRTKRLFVYAIVPTQYVFTTSKQIYTIGPTGDFVAVRPNKIVRANLVRTAPTIDEHIPLEILDMQQDYSRVRYPATSGAEPYVLFVRYDYPNVSLIPWPYPEAGNAVALANALELFTWSPLSSFADLTTLYDLPDGYEDAVTLTLGERLCSAMGVTCSPELRESAAAARVAVGSLNSVPPKLDTSGDYYCHRSPWRGWCG